MRKMARLFWTAFYKFKYRKVDDSVCCCGASDCIGDYDHCYVNAKEHHISTLVNDKVGGRHE